jgi:hypothetical protein
MNAYQHRRNEAHRARLRAAIAPKPFGAALYALRVREAQRRLVAFTTPVHELGRWPVRGE